jgi:hypothetical protein
MTPEEKRLKVTAPIPLERVLKMYGVNSETELMNLLKDKFHSYSRHFLQNQEKKSINTKLILLIVFVFLFGCYFMFSESLIQLIK